MIILYAEDDPEDVEVFCEAVRSIDASIGCIIARDGLEALKILENAVILPDFIFLDINMPLVDGRECLIRIRGNRQFNNIPVIMYTTSNRKDDMSGLRNLGATDYIIKPNTFNEVFRHLSKVLKAS